MKKAVLYALIPLFFLTSVGADDCASIAARLKIPVKLKTRGRPKIAKWEQVDKILNELDQNVRGKPCELVFGDIFRAKDQDLYFPVTNTVLRVTPENTFVGLMVHHKEGTVLGDFVQRVLYERSGGLYATRSYSLYYFRFKDPSGEVQSSGRDLLLDSFAVRWEDLRSKVAVSGK